MRTTRRTTRMMREHHGFSMVEMVLSIGIGSALLAGGLYFVSTSGFDREESPYSRAKEMRRKIAEKSKELSRSAYGQKFSDIINGAGVSTRYFKMPVKFPSNDDHCGKKKSGGCFMKMNLDDEGLPVFDKLDSTVVKSSGSAVTGVNFFRDERISGMKDKSRYLFSKETGLKIRVPEQVHYKSKVYQSADGRYFVGYRVTGEETSRIASRRSKAFYVMTTVEDRVFFEIDSYRGTTKEAIQSVATSCGGVTTSTAERFLSGVDKKMLVYVPDNFRNKEYYDKYKNMFYLFFYPNNPQIYFVGFIKSFKQCSNNQNRENWTSAERISCNQLNKVVGIPLAARGANGQAPNRDQLCSMNQDYDKDFQVNLATSDEITMIINAFFGGNYGDYKDFADDMWPKPGVAGKYLPRTYNVSVGSKSATGSYIPFFPYLSPTLELHRGNSREDSEEVEEYYPTVNAHYLINHFSSTAQGPRGFSPASRLIAVPVDIHKFYVEKEGTGDSVKKNLYHTKFSGAKGSGGTHPYSQAPRAVMRGISKDSHVVFARQLGRNRFSTFLVNKEEWTEKQKQKQEEEMETLDSGSEENL